MSKTDPPIHQKEVAIWGLKATALADDIDRALRLRGCGPDGPKAQPIAEATTHLYRAAADLKHSIGVKPQT